MHPDTTRKLSGLTPLPERLWLSSPTMHGDELHWMTEAYETNWMSTVGENINEVEHQVAELCGVPYAVALSSGTAALHLAVKLAAARYTALPPVILEMRRLSVSVDSPPELWNWTDGEMNGIETVKGFWMPSTRR